MTKTRDSEKEALSYDLPRGKISLKPVFWALKDVWGDVGVRQRHAKGGGERGRKQMLAKTLRQANAESRRVSQAHKDRVTTLGKSRGPSPRDPAETPAETPAEAPENPLRGKFPRKGI